MKNKNIKNVVFICGAGGDAGMTYVTELKKFCEQKGYNFYAPHMPAFADGITYEKYKSSFEKTCENLDWSTTLIVCQSVGTNFIVKYFGTNPLDIAGYISVSGFSKDLDKPLPQETLDRLKILNDFRPSAEDYTKFKNTAFPKYSIYGGKDIFFTPGNLEGYADMIGSDKYFDENGVHCTISENVTKHELLHKVIDENFI